MKIKFRPLAVSGLLLFAVLLAALYVLAADDAQRRPSVASGAVTSVAPSSDAAASRAANRRDLAAKRRLESRRARRERLRSRRAYRHLDDRQAVTVARRKQPAVASAPTVQQPEILRGEHVVAYPSANAALIRSAGGARMAMVESPNAPIAAPNPDATTASSGQKLEGLDLALEDAGTAWHAKLPAVDVQLPKSGSSSARIGDDVRLTLPNRSGGATLSGDTKAFYANQLPDTDVVLEPVNTGVELSWVLRSPAAPKKLDINLSLASGADTSVAVSLSGGASLLLDGKPIASISPPQAWDAQGTAVPTRLTKSGRGLAVLVDHGGDYAYPIGVDPIIGVVKTNPLPYITEGRDKYGDNAPRYSGWQRTDPLPAGFWTTYPGDSNVGLALAPGSQGAGASAWWYFNPIRQSSVFRVEYIGASRQDGPAILNTGIHGNSIQNQFGDSGTSYYWQSPADPATDNPTVSTGGPFSWEGGLAKGVIRTCALNCGYGGNLDNLAVFQLNAKATSRTAAMGAYFDYAYIYHREQDPPILGTISGIPSGWSNQPFNNVSIPATDNGIGFCSDRGVHDPAVVPNTLNVYDADTAAPQNWVGSQIVTGCVGQTQDSPATGSLTLRWDEANAGNAIGTPSALPEGARNVNFVVSDMFGNSATKSMLVKKDITPPRVKLGGRLGDLVRQQQVDGLWQMDARTYAGPADLSVSIADSDPNKAIATSGVSTAAGVNQVWIDKLDPQNGSIIQRAATLMTSAASCTGGNPGLEGCDMPTKYFSSSDLSFGAGVYQLSVQVRDNAGNAKVYNYHFIKSDGEFSTIVEGQTTARWIPVQVERKLWSCTGTDCKVAFQWKTGSRAFADVPASALATEADPGTPLTDAFVPLSLIAPQTYASGRYVLDIDALLQSASLTDLDKGSLQIRAMFGPVGPDHMLVVGPAPGQDALRASEDVTIRLDSGGRTTQDETQTVGDATIDLQTGNLALNVTDASINGFQSGLSLQRSYGSRYSQDKSGVLGPGWRAELPVDGVTPWARAIDMDDPARAAFPPTATHYEDRYPFVALETQDGGGIVFERSDSDSSYKPQAGFENFQLTRLVSNGATTGFVLTDRSDGSSTTFGTRLDDPSTPWSAGLPEHGTYGVSGIASPNIDHSPRWTYKASGTPVANQGISGLESAAKRWLPTEATAATATGVDCSTDANQRGCQSLLLTYGMVAGEIRLTGLSLRAWDPDASPMQMVTKSVKTYLYDTAGRLTRARDTASGYGTDYTYQGDTALIASIKPPGEPATPITYASGSGDKSPGRIETVSARTTPAAGESGVWRFVYGDRKLDGALSDDMSPAQVARWAQTAVPVRAAAAVPPSKSYTGDAAAKLAILKASEITYLDAMGRSVDVVEPGGATSVTEYNKWGDPVRTLSASNMVRALAAGAASAATAQRLSTLTTYEVDGRNQPYVCKIVGPEHDAQLATTSSASGLVTGSVVRARNITLNRYDGRTNGCLTGTIDPKYAPTDAPFDLVTTTRSGLLVAPNADGTGGTETEMRQVDSEYQPSSRKPVSTTRNPGTANSATTRVIRDGDGRETERHQPAADSPTAATTTVTSYYQAGGAAASPSNCTGRPEWAGLVCQTGPPVLSAGAGIPRIRMDYDYWLRPYRTTESVIDASGATQTIVHTITFDSKGRRKLETITPTGSDTGAAPSIVRHVYDDEGVSGAPPTAQQAGREIETRRQNDAGTVTDKIVKTYDTLGRLATYQDTQGFKTTTTYDVMSRPVGEMLADNGTTIDSKAYVYDDAGRVRDLTDSALGSNAIHTDYDADGKATTILYPWGLKKTFAYDESGNAVSAAYTQTTGCATSCTRYSESAARGLNNSIVRDVSTVATSDYMYDELGRLSAAGQKVVGASQCQTRSYSYDADANRQNSKLASGTSCPPADSGTAVNLTYDTSNQDRLVSVNAYGLGAQALAYDSWGRTTTVPQTALDGNSSVAMTYFANGLTKTESSAGTLISYDRDALGRTRGTTTTPSGQTGTTEKFGYSGDDDSPEVSKIGSAWTRYLDDQSGQLSVQVTSGGTKTLEVTSLTGGVVGEIPATSAGTFSPNTTTDAFGVAASSSSKRYGFQGGSQRPTAFGGNLIEMGVRTYNPWIGRFLQRDPIPGGSANAYDYSNQDPVNQSDPSGGCPICFVVLELIAEAGLEDIVGASTMEALTAGTTGTVTLSAGETAAFATLAKYAPKITTFLQSLRGLPRGGGIQHAMEGTIHDNPNYNKYKIAYETHTEGRHQAPHVSILLWKEHKPGSGTKIQLIQREDHQWYIEHGKKEVFTKASGILVQHPVFRG